ncbi:hypothetical protein FHA54_03890 [Escherichia coli]|nr:hypothetical protein [Escherichia coli]
MASVSISCPSCSATDGVVRRKRAKRVTGSDERKPPQKHPAAGRPLPV